MQLQVDIRGYALTTLLDTSSTHNFVSLKTADGLRLAYSSNQGFQATVANGDKIHCRQIANSIGMSIAGEEFLMDAYAIPLDSFDIILGITFLRTLGPIFGILKIRVWHSGGEDSVFSGRDWVRSAGTFP